MKQIKFFCFAAAICVMTACGSNNSSDSQNEDTLEVTAEEVVVDSMPAGEVSESESKSSASAENWDSVLDEYENYCNKVVSLSKKAAAGDMSAITEYASTLESAQSLQQKLENAESDMTAAQITRLNKIVSKMSSAIM